jgi:hypothetical protein
MRSPSPPRLSATAASLCAIALTALAGCASHEPTTTITADQLRESLTRSGVRIDPRRGHPRKSDSEVIGGIAHGEHGARVEFEFVVTAGRRARTDELGTLDIPFRSDGVNRNRPLRVRTATGDLVTPVIRGVLGNVAYATYYFGIREAPPAATDDVVRRLDRALFNTFPPTDAEAHAIRRTP